MVKKILLVALAIILAFVKEAVSGEVLVERVDSEYSLEVGYAVALAWRDSVSTNNDTLEDVVIVYNGSNFVGGYTVSDNGSDTLRFSYILNSKRLMWFRD